MKNIEITLLLLSSVATFTVGIFTFYKNPKSITNRLFAFLVLCLIVWSFANYISVNETSFTLLAIKAIFICVLLQNAALLFLIYAYPHNYYKFPKYLTRLYLPFVFVVLLLVPTNYIIAGLNNGQVVAGSVIPLFVISAVVTLVTGFIVLVRRLVGSAGRERSKILFLLFSTLILWVFIPVTNFILPMIGVNNFINFSSIYVLIFSIIIGFAIVKHGLFDIRILVARVVAYVLSIAVILLAYALLLYGLTTFAFENISSTDQAILFVVLSICTSFAIQPLKKYFDRMSNNIFYQDKYDMQELINQINFVLVNTVDLKEPLQKIAAIIESNVKLTYADFYLSNGLCISTKDSKRTLKAYGTSGWQKLQKYIYSNDGNIFLVDNDADPSVKRQIELMDAGCIIKLLANNEKVGLMVLGPRRSGNVYSDDDIRLFTIIANEVAIAVQNALRFEEIAEFNLNLQKKIDSATTALQKSNEKLKALDEAKDEFISMASHQLRTPLTSVKGYVSMVLEGDAGEINEQQRTFLDQAMVSSQRMVYLIADLLNVSRLKTGKFVIDARPTYLPDVVESEINQLYETAKGRELTLKFTKPKSFPTVNLDETKIRQVIMNFVDNAIYYTPKGGKIDILLKANPKSIEFVVKDSGIGVPRQDQHKLFSKFYRAGNARKARPDGTGLGLYMAKKVVVAQGGAIIFDTAEGKGSSFGFKFPIL